MDSRPCYCFKYMYSQSTKLTPPPKAQISFVPTDFLMDYYRIKTLSSAIYRHCHGIVEQQQIDQSSLLIGCPYRINSIICLLYGSAGSEWQGPAPAPAHLGTLILIHYALGYHQHHTQFVHLVVMCSARPNSLRPRCV